MNKSIVFIFVVILLQIVVLACGLGGLTTESPAEPAEPAEQRFEIQSNDQSTPAPAGLTFLEALQAAEPQLQEWAPDAQPSQRWQCSGQLTEAGVCNEWRGVMASAEKIDAANVVTRWADEIWVQPSNSEMVGRPAVEAAFSVEGIMDSPEALQAAWRWLEEQGLREGESRVGLGLFAGPAQALNCGEAPHYVVNFDRPNGERAKLCIDAYSGQVTSSSFDK